MRGYVFYCLIQSEKRLVENKLQMKGCEFFHLKIITYPQNKYGERGMDDPLEKITSAEAVAYKDVHARRT